MTTGLDYLLAPDKHPPAALCVVTGDEAYLKREVLNTLRRVACGSDEGDGQGDFAWNAFTGREVEWRDVSDALSSVSLFGGGVQAAVVEEADSFVTQYRPQLEDYLAGPPKGAVLVLDVKTWNGSTRLAKAAAKAGLVLKCGVPDRGAELGAFKRGVKKWLAQRGKDEHGAKLEPAAAEMLLDLLPLSLGVLDQEVAKLALMATDGKIDAQHVQANVGGWRTRKTWDMIDAAADGDAADALAQLDRLIAAGEQPIGLLAQVSSTLRKFAAAACLFEQAERSGRRSGLRPALEQAGIPKFKLGDAERQLKQIGRGRAGKIDEWLLASDLAMKGHNSTPARSRHELERLLVRLAKQTDPRRVVGQTVSG